MKFIVDINATDFFKAGGEAIDKKKLEKVITDATNQATKMIDEHLQRRNKSIERWSTEAKRVIKQLGDALGEDVTVKLNVRHNEEFTIAPPGREMPVATADGLELKGPERRILGSLVVWKSLGHDTPTRSQVAFVAGYSPDGSAFTNPLGALKSGDRITYPSMGRVQLLNPEGAQDLGISVEALIGRLKGPERRILDAVRQGRATRAEIAERASYSPDGSAFTNPLGRLRSLELIDYPATGEVELTGWAAELLGSLPANT